MQNPGYDRNFSEANVLISYLRNCHSPDPEVMKAMLQLPGISI